MNKYEIMFIVRPDLDEEGTKALVENFTNVLTTNGANVLETNDWGMKELAYEIQKYKKGHYFLLVTEADSAEANNEFDRLALISEDIIRHMIIKQVV